MNKKRIAAMLVILCVIASNLTGCFGRTDSAAASAPAKPVIKAYRNIPDITPDEINAIEALKNSNKSFTYGSMYSMESFELPDGTYAGFSPLFCELLSELFSIRFVFEPCEWDELRTGFGNGTIDFTGDLTATPERKKTYFMSLPIAERGLKIFTYDITAELEYTENKEKSEEGEENEESETAERKNIEIKVESDVSGLKIGFYKDTITAMSILESYPSLRFEIIGVTDSSEAAEKLISGEIDAFVSDAGSALFFDDYGAIKSKKFFPMVYTPVSLTTANPELEPIISAVDKYIKAGGIDKLEELYMQGNTEYARYVLGKSFTDEEKKYIADLTESGKRVPVALEHDNYPTSFYNENDDAFQGIVPDILAEITSLTGIRFERVTNQYTLWSEMVQMLRRGDAAVVSELIKTEERVLEGRFLFADEPYATSRYALLSKIDYPNLEMHQVIRATVGVGKGSAYEEIFLNYFPNHQNIKYYDSHNKLMAALEEGEIDLVMASENTLTALTNYREKSGYEVNIIFYAPIEESYFGFNKDEVILRSIFSKAQSMIDAERIESDWKGRSFDYEKKIAEQLLNLTNQRTGYMIAVIAAVLLAFLVLVVMYIRNSRKDKIISNQTSVISAIYETLPDLVFSKDMHGKYTSCNHAYEEMAGSEKSKIIGRLPHQIDSFQQGDMSNKFIETDNQVIEKNKTIKFEHWFVFPDKTRRFFETIKTPLIKNGTVTGLLGISRDVTPLKSALDAEKEAVKQIQAANDRINIMLDATPLCCQIWNRELICTDCNEAAVRLYGLSDKQEYMDRFFEFSPEYQPDGRKSSEAAVECIEKAFDEGRCVFEWTHLLPHGELMPALITLVRVNYKGEDVVAGYTWDMREHKKMLNQVTESLEEAQRASVAKSAFLSRMSHEIRTPMNAIIGMTELTLREDVPPQAREHIITVKQASANLLAIINDILDFSKIETGKMSVIPGDYLFSSLINDVISIIRMRTLDSQIRFVVNIDSNIPNSLYGDETRIRQVLINLLGNAVKYTEKGFVALNISGEMIRESTIKLTIEVQDSGKGIKEEDLDKLFKEFGQVDVEKNRGIEGVGLGLAISHSIVKAMDGTIGVKSEYGKGSSFTVELPQKIRSLDRLAEVENAASKNILVYERRAIYADSIMRTIDNLGAPSVLVTDDSDLKDRLSKGSYDFILLAFSLFSQNKDNILKLAPKCKVILLTEFGETIHDGSWSVIAMPVNAISIANILNGLSDNYSYNEGPKPETEFTAPDARVLVVDDISTNLKVAEGLMLPYKMQVDLRKSGMSAIEAIKAARYDLVFMDHRMPEMDGVETTQFIRGMGKDDPYYTNVPIIALTANAVTGMKEMFLENGFNDFLSKPIDTVKLNVILEKWIINKGVSKSEQSRAEAVQKTSGVTPETDRSEKSVGAGDINIEGIDVKIGLLHLGGKTDLYLETLAVFQEDVLEKIREIRKSLETDDLPLYTIHVHALKSASANIGALKISETAKVLEMAGKQEDSGFIETHNENFLNELETLLGNIGAFLAIRSGGPGELDEEKFKAELAALKTALEDMDAQAIRKGVDNLKKLSSDGKISEVVKEISKHILLFDYDHVISIIDSLM